MFMGLPQIETTSQIFENENACINEMDLINGFSRASPSFSLDPPTGSGWARGATLRLLQIRRSDFTFIWIRCSDFICITFASIAYRRSDFVFCISGIQTSPSDGSDVHNSFVSHLLAPQFRRSDFIFCISGV